VTNIGSDRDQLSAMAKLARASMGVEELTAIAGPGLFQGRGNSGLRRSRDYGHSPQDDNVFQYPAEVRNGVSLAVKKSPEFGHGVSVK